MKVTHARAATTQHTAMIVARAGHIFGRFRVLSFDTVVRPTKVHFDMLRFRFFEALAAPLLASLGFE